MPTAPTRPASQMGKHLYCLPSCLRSTHMFGAALSGQLRCPQSLLTGRATLSLHSTPLSSPLLVYAGVVIAGMLTTC
jgi:hypothetical protein